MTDIYLFEVDIEGDILQASYLTLTYCPSLEIIAIIIQVLQLHHYSPSQEALHSWVKHLTAMQLAFCCRNAHPSLCAFGIFNHSGLELPDLSRRTKHDSPGAQCTLILF